MSKSNSEIIEILKSIDAEYSQSDLIIVTDREGRIELYNNVLSQLCNSANQDEILNTKVNLSVLFDSEADSFEIIFSNLADKKIWEGKLNFILNYNQRIPFNAKGFLLTLAADSPLKYLFTLKFAEIDDIEQDPLTQKIINKPPVSTNINHGTVPLVESYEELQQLKDDFLSSVSHELRTPLASIIGFTETIKNDPNIPSNIRSEFIDIIFNEGKRLAAMINDLLDISQIEKQSITLNLSYTIINNVIQQVFNNYKSLAEEKKINYKLKLLKNPVQAKVDGDKIQQIVSNLISNAIKFTPSNGMVEVSLTETSERFTITVKDTGIGIPKKDLNKIFQKFYRVHRPGLEIRGAGLGLAICKHLARLHDGDISVQSEENRGSLFQVTIPKMSDEK